ncbi:MAG: ABC-F family ATP-binding cassette domain-containing protein [Deltaproteobacteria bacterium]|nr:ABC-F family ATP-binding cassette domain-containing protein [Deltaproteobacteria bacterium]
MIFLNNVAKFFNGKPLFEQVNLSIHRGDRVGIVGPNGAGKSTILGMMEGVISPDEGDVSIEKRIRMGVLHQELIRGNDGPILEEIMNVSDELREIKISLSRLEQQMEILSEDSNDAESLLERHGRLQSEFERYQGYTLEARALKVLQGLGFDQDDSRRRWSEFSGGWRMRVALAKILLAEPDILLLDEPTNHLDLESLLWVEDYLIGFKGAMVLVSHDRAFLNRLISKVVEAERGKVSLYTGNYDDYDRNRQMQEDVLLASFKNQQEKIKRIQQFINRNRVKARTASRVQSRVKMLDKMELVEPPQRPKSLKFKFPQPSHSGRRVLEIRDLAKSFGNKTVYSGLNFTVQRGDRVGLVGPNGAGKSTLMKIMAGVLPYDNGTATYGHLVKPGYFAQHQYETLNSDLTVLEEAYSASPKIPEQDVRNLLGAFLFSGDDVLKKVKVLSGGERSRLALTKILLNPPNFLLMDEPTNHLDISSCEILEDGLKKFEGTLVLITHDRRLMNGICTGILEIDGGGTEYFLGNYDDYRQKKLQIDLEQLETSVQRPVPPANEIVDDTTRGSRKERKRREAQNRMALSRIQAPIKEEIRRLEKQIEVKETRRKEIETLLSDQSVCTQRDRVVPLLAEEPVLARDIKELETQWEALQTRLEEAENRLLTG